MSITRVTQQMLTSSSYNSVNNSLVALSDAQNVLNTGKRVQKPSDDPTATTTAIRARSGISDQNQYLRNAQDGTGWLTTIDSAVQSVASQVTRASTLTLQGANTGANDDQSRQAIVQELQQIRTGLFASANSAYLGRPVFGGTTTDSQAYAAGYYVPMATAGIPSDGTVTEPVNGWSTVAVDPATYQASLTGAYSFVADPNAVTGDPNVDTQGGANGYWVPAADLGAYGPNWTPPAGWAQTESVDPTVGSASPAQYMFVRDDNADTADPNTAIQYVGDGGSVSRRVGPDTVIRVDSDGAKVFGNVTASGTASQSIFDTLSSLCTAMTTGDQAGITAGLNALNGFQAVLDASEADEGARSNQITQATNVANTQLLSLQQIKSNSEDADVATSTIAFQSATVQYQAALAATAKTVQPSLLDFLS